VARAGAGGSRLLKFLGEADELTEIKDTLDQGQKDTIQDYQSINPFY